MTNDERRPLLSEDASPKLSSSIPPRDDDAEASQQHVDAKPDTKDDLFYLAAKVAAVVVSFAATGLAQAAVGVSTSLPPQAITNQRTGHDPSGMFLRSAIATLNPFN
jgi:hypothetical protein